jgi:hypothetical protein
MIIKTYFIPCSLRLCCASSSVVLKAISPHCSHFNDLLVLVLSGPGGDSDEDILSFYSTTYNLQLCSFVKGIL